VGFASLLHTGARLAPSVIGYNRLDITMAMRRIIVLGVLTVSLGFFGCDQAISPMPPGVTEAVAVIHPTTGYTATGTVTLKQESGMLRITVAITGLSPGQHGFHVHEKGDCSGGDGKAAGGHFNPYGTDHGAPTSEVRHVGDLGNITADANGNASVVITDKMATLNDGPANVLGRAFIVHAGADDFVSQPSGAAGSRVGCGVIGQR